MPRGQDRSSSSRDTVENMWKNSGQPVESLSAQKKDRPGSPQFRIERAVEPAFVSSFACLSRPAAEQWGPLLRPEAPKQP
jgi:hypothetical protein